MREKRFFTNHKNLQTGEKVLLDADESRHLAKVLRLDVGDLAMIFNGNGRLFEGEIISSSATEACVLLKKELSEERESESNITVILAYPKNQAMDSLLPKLVELGVKRIIIFQGRYSAIKIENESKKQERMKKIIRESAKQCRRLLFPSFHLFDSLESAFVYLKELNKEFSLSERFIFDAKFDSDTFSEKLKASVNSFQPGQKAKKDFILLFGSEGGLGFDEITEAFQNGFTDTSLGKRILKVETAVVSAVSILMASLGEM